jgi:hypothetical protein
MFSSDLQNGFIWRMSVSSPHCGKAALSMTMAGQRVLPGRFRHIGDPIG